jgi:hypothetical protein
VQQIKGFPTTMSRSKGSGHRLKRPSSFLDMKEWKPQPPRKPPAHKDMSEQRYDDLMKQLGAAFAKQDDGETKRRQAREKELRHAQWNARREQVIREILVQMRALNLHPDDLL